MKRGNQGKGIHRLEDGTLLGVNLGADFTAEHEWGIKDLRRKYGIDDSVEGIARRQIRSVPADHLLFDAVTLKTRNWETRKTTSATWWGLISFSYSLDISLREPRSLTEEVVSNCGLTPYDKDELTGAWDERSFGVLMKGEAPVRELHTALENLDLCIGLFNGESWNPFSRSGLGLLIASRVPQSVRDQWLASDRDGRKLVEAAQATGIAKRLEDAGLRYYALSPKWAGEIRSTKDGEIKTKHSVIYWLNPQQQDQHNYGWSTVEQLEQWIKGKGPIPKTAKQKASA